MRIHTTLSGHEIHYPEPHPKLARFLQRVQALAEDPEATEDDLIALVYGAENPILQQDGLFSGRGTVTREVLEDPVYHVLSDLIARKRVAMEGIDVRRLAARYTLSVTDAAQQLGVHSSALYKAIRSRRLPSWVRDGQVYLDPNLLSEHEFGRRGPLPKDVEPLEYRAGYEAGSMLQIRYPGMPAQAEPGESRAKGISEGQIRGITEGQITRWRRVGVLTGAKGKLRCFVLEPATEANEIVFQGFFVRGRFRVAAKENNAANARRAWEAFKPS